MAAFDDANPSPTEEAGGGVSIDEFFEARVRGDFVGGFTLGAGGFSSPVAVALGTPPESVITMIPASLEQGPTRTGNALAWGRAHHAAFAQRYRRTASVAVLSSQLAEDANRVELHPTLTDDFGTPAPKVIYQLSENSKKLLAFAVERSKELLEAAGATEILKAGFDTQSIGRGAAPGHYMGTARMGTDPGRSVVDKWGRTHDVKNLFIIDGSVFTTSGCQTPTSTIQAIALRTADYIKTQARTLLT
jgi:choline dehydrogenase-like flavoprotein